LPKIHHVKEGDDIASIAIEHGFLPDTIWNDSANAKLKKKRKDPFLLYPGDEVTIPEKKPRREQAETDKRSTFRRKGSLVEFSLVLEENGKPLANQDYTLTIDSHFYEGTTDNEGLLTQKIPPNARRGKLIHGEDKDVLELKFGYVDPIDLPSGIQDRLLNLGYYTGDINGELTEETTAAIAEFQRAHDLSGNGELTDETKQKLLEIHGS
jgi:N-acetylmuramoyl-L-alanine amidase